jgi:RNA-splicing ligase RtcB
VLRASVPNMGEGDADSMRRRMLQHHTECRGVGGFLPAVKQIANVAALPGIVGVRRPPGLVVGGGAGC